MRQSVADRAAKTQDLFIRIHYYDHHRTLLCLHSIMTLLGPCYICLYENSTELLAKLTVSYVKQFRTWKDFPFRKINKLVGSLSALDFEKRR